MATPRNLEDLLMHIDLSEVEQRVAANLMENTFASRMGKLSEAFKTLGTVFGIEALQAFRQFERAGKMLSDYINPFTEIENSRMRNRGIRHRAAEEELWDPNSGGVPSVREHYVVEEIELPPQYYEVSLPLEMIEEERDLRDRKIRIRLERYGDGRTEVYVGNRKVGELEALRKRAMRKAYREPLPPRRIKKPKDVRLIRE